MPKPIVIYGGDSNKDRTGLGPKSITRIHRALDFINASPDDSFTMYLAAGSHPAHPDKSALKKMYADYLKQHFLGHEFCLFGDYGFFGVHHIVDVVMLQDNGWGTDEETELLIHEFPELLSQELTIVSSASHRARIETSWRLFANKGVTVITCDHSEKTGNSILEFVKTIECYLFAYTYHVFGRSAYLLLSGMKNNFIKWGDVHW